MSRVTELEKALTTLFRKGTEVGYTETEIDEFLENIDYHALLQAVWNKAETVYAYRADGKNALSLDYRSSELFKQRATLLYEDVGDSYIGAVFAARSMELWLLEDIQTQAAQHTVINRAAVDGNVPVAPPDTPPRCLVDKAGNGMAGDDDAVGVIAQLILRLPREKVADAAAFRMAHFALPRHGMRQKEAASSRLYLRIDRQTAEDTQHPGAHRLRPVPEGAVCPIAAVLHPLISLCPQRCRCGLFCALCATPLPRPATRF